MSNLWARSESVDIENTSSTSRRTHQPIKQSYSVPPKSEIDHTTPQIVTSVSQQTQGVDVDTIFNHQQKYISPQPSTQMHLNNFPVDDSLKNSKHTNYGNSRDLDVQKHKLPGTYDTHRSHTSSFQDGRSQCCSSDGGGSGVETHNVPVTEYESQQFLGTSITHTPVVSQVVDPSVGQRTRLFEGSTSFLITVDVPHTLLSMWITCLCVICWWTDVP